MNKKILMVTIASVTYFGMILNFDIVKGASYCKASGAYTYCAGTGNNVSKVKTIEESRVYHTKGYDTRVDISKSKTTTMGATADFSFGFDFGFTATANLGLSVSVSHTVSVNIGYTIPRTKANAYYRIDQVFPGNSVTFQQFKTSDYSLVNRKSVTWAPKRNAAYHKLTQYA